MHDACICEVLEIFVGASKANAFMSRRVANGLLLVGALAAIALPILAALYLAHQQSIDEVSERASSIAAEILRRSDAATQQAFAAEARLHERARADPCSPEGVARMRDVALGSSYLQAVGHLVGNQVLCSSFEAQARPVDIGVPDYVTAAGEELRAAVDLGVSNDKRFIVLAKSGYAVAIDPATFITVPEVPLQYSLGMIGNQTGLVFSRRGEFDPKAGSDLRQLASGVHIVRSHLLVVQRSGSDNMLAYVAVPTALVQGRLRSAAMVLVPLGLLLGGGLVLVSYLLLRGQSSLPALLRRALRKRQFVVCYQPIVDLHTRRPVGMEALLHWPHSDGTETSADVFIPAAEQCGLINRITTYVIAQVARDAPQLLRNWPDGFITINLSSSDLHSDAVVESLGQLLTASGVAGHNIMVEATEHSFVDPKQAERTVRQIRKMGIKVIIDDFGTGFCSLSYLTGLQTDYLKIDRTYVEAVGTDSVTSEVALHIINVARTLGLKVIGEGVETECQAEFLHRNEVTLAQGWLFARAIPLNATLEYLEQWQKRVADPVAEVPVTS